jgi:hypothetical protein
VKIPRTRRRVGPDLGQFRTPAHHFLDVQQQAPPEAAARVRAREVLLGEAARLEHRDGEGVAHRERGGRARRRREV